MTASFNNVLFIFDNATEDDLATYQYELYEEDDIVNPNATNYILKPGSTLGTFVSPLKSGSGNSSVFAVPVEGSYIDEENDNIVVQKSFFGRVRSVDTSGNVSEWTSIVKTDLSTPLIDSQYVVSLTADKIKAGEIESAAITLGGANPAETIIQSKTYVTSLGQQGWFIDGLGEFSFGGPEGINYSGESITIGSDVQVTANLAADSISVGSGLTQLNINEAINGGTGGMTLGSGGNNYWYSNGNFRVGGSTSRIEWNGSTLSVVGEVTATTGTIGGWSIQPSFIRSANSSVTLNSNGLLEIGTSSTNKASITADGDFTVIGDGGGSYGIGTASFFGPWYEVMKGSNPAATNQPLASLTYKDFTFFTNKSGGYKIFIGGGNDNNNAFIDVGATGITDNNSISCSGWFRSSGASGWYNQTYGGGIYMDETTTIKVLGNKNFSTGGVINSFKYTGITADINSGSSEFATMAIRRNFTNVDDKRFVTFLRGSTEVGRIKYVDGNNDKIEYLTTSDKRLKEKIKPIEGALEIISKIEPVSYVFKSGGNEEHGFLAQDMFEVYDKVVSKPLSDDERWMLNYAGMTPLLTAGLKELNDKIIRLEQKIFFLEEKP